MNYLILALQDKNNILNRIYKNKIYEPLLLKIINEFAKFFFKNTRIKLNTRIWDHTSHIINQIIIENRHQNIFKIIHTFDPNIYLFALPIHMSHDIKINWLTPSRIQIYKQWCLYIKGTFNEFEINNISIKNTVKCIISQDLGTIHCIFINGKSIKKYESNLFITQIIKKYIK